MRGFVIFGFEDSRGVHIHGSDQLDSWKLDLNSIPIYSLTHREPVRELSPVLDLEVCMLNSKIVSDVNGNWGKALYVLLSRWQPNPQEMTLRELTE